MHDLMIDEPFATTLGVFPNPNSSQNKSDLVDSIICWLISP
jgi:hypothetical protein